MWLKHRLHSTASTDLSQLPTPCSRLSHFCSINPWRVCSRMALALWCLPPVANTKIGCRRGKKKHKSTYLQHRFPRILVEKAKARPGDQNDSIARKNSTEARWIGPRPQKSWVSSSFLLGILGVPSFNPISVFHSKSSVALSAKGEGEFTTAEPIQCKTMDAMELQLPSPSRL